MLSTRELVSSLKALKDAYLKERESIVLSMADDATALMKLRVIERKVNAEGSIFGRYADSTLEIKRKKGRLSSSGDPSLINFSDTNRMWSGAGTSFDGVSARVISNSQGLITVSIQPHDDDNRIDVLDDLEDRFGDIVSWSESEQGLLISIYESKFEDLKNKFGF